MTPTLGSVVTYGQYLNDEKGARVGVASLPALVTRVWSPTVVDLYVLPSDGRSAFTWPSVEYSATPDGGCWSWPAATP